MLKKTEKKEPSCSWKAIGALNITYFVSFGSELAVISILPLFYETIFLVSPITSGLLASLFAVINLFARPLGGWISDKINRKKTIVILMSSVAISFVLMSIITKYDTSHMQAVTTLTPLFSGALWLGISIFITLTCSVFVQSSEGATVAVIPLINKTKTGQLTGLISSYGNFGGLFFLLIYSFFDTKVLFVSIAMMAAISSIYCYFFLEV